ncbi:plasmid partition protein ParG [Sutterella sp.]|uniref:plasmid partition protein ParG n=1 Tax=Sutterella sp. TaxID=1981025 RepID=UPI003FD8C022
MNPPIKNVPSVGSTGISKSKSDGLAAGKATTVRVNFDLDRDQHIKLKLFATRQGKTIKEVLSDYVAQLPAQGA